MAAAHACSRLTCVCAVRDADGKKKAYTSMA
jgi:hypothetical protein